MAPFRSSHLGLGDLLTLSLHIRFELDPQALRNLLPKLSRLQNLVIFFEVAPSFQGGDELHEPHDTRSSIFLPHLRRLDMTLFEDDAALYMFSCPQLEHLFIDTADGVSPTIDINQFPSLRTFEWAQSPLAPTLSSLRRFNSLVAISSTHDSYKDVEELLLSLCGSTSTDAQITCSSLQFVRIAPFHPLGCDALDVTNLLRRRPNIVLEWVYWENPVEETSMRDARQNAIDLFGKRVVAVSRRDVRPLFEVFA